MCVCECVCVRLCLCLNVILGACAHICVSASLRSDSCPPVLFSSKLPVLIWVLLFCEQGTRLALL